MGRFGLSFSTRTTGGAWEGGGRKYKRTENTTQKHAETHAKEHIRELFMEQKGDIVDTTRRQRRERLATINIDKLSEVCGGSELGST